MINEWIWSIYCLTLIQWLSRRNGTGINSGETFVLTQLSAYALKYIAWVTLRSNSLKSVKKKKEKKNLYFYSA